MGANSYDISVDELFQTHSIQEIDQIQKKLLADVEKKREELRTMVGERYRDLLKAADTIAKMKDTSTSVVTQIEEIGLHCRNLNEKQLIGFKTDTYGTNLQNKQLITYFSTVVQIKLLTSLPEMIWSNIDNNRYFLATQLFIFSRHISTGLQLDIDNSFIKYFPVAKKQWELLKPFYLTIKQVSTVALEKETVSVELACDCLLAIFLLEKSSLEEVLNTFLHLRTKAYLATLCSSDRGTKRRVRDRILASLQVLNSTIDLIEKCFIGKGNSSDTDEATCKGLIFEELEKLSDASAPATIELMQLDDTDLVDVLPDITLKFKPSFPTSILSVVTVKQKVENWYLSISNVANNQLKNLFDLITSMKTLQEIQKQSLEAEKLFENTTGSGTGKLNETLSLTTSSAFYQNLYKPLLNARTREIIRQCWKNCIESTCNEVDRLLKQATYKIADKHESEMYNEIESEFWEDHISDLPLNLKIALNQDKKQNKLLMKSKGYNDDIIKICTSFDERLKCILDDLNFFLFENTGKIEEKQKLIDFVKDISRDNSKKFLQIIENKYNNIENDNNKTINNTKSFMILNNFILIARILSALIELCPNFKLCLTYTYIYGSGTNSSSSSSRNNDGNREKLSGIICQEDKTITGLWYQICKLFEEESFMFWKTFCNKFHEKYSIDNYMKIDTFDHQFILQDFLNWDTITIEEHDEHDNPLKSTIKIPSQIRISLQIYFYELIKSLNNFIPETLPTKVLRYFNGILLKNLLKNTMNLLEKNDLLLNNQNQNISLQLYFDMKFIQLFFLTRDDKNEFELIQKLLNTFKSNIDPFDFELFHTHINNNIKKFIIRMQHQLGIIFPYLDNITILIGGTSGGTSIVGGSGNDATKQSLLSIGHLDKDPNVLCISCNGSSSTWFSLLPIAVSNKMQLSTSAGLTLSSLSSSSTDATDNSSETKSNTKKLNDVTGTGSNSSTNTGITKQPTTSSSSSSSTQASQSYASNVKSGAAAFFGAMSQDWFR